MWSFTQLFSLAILAVTALGAVTPLHAVKKFNGPTSVRFIVKVKDGISKASVLQKIHASGSITHDWDILNGFAGHLDDAALATLRASPDVEFVAEDGIMHTMTTQTNAPWGLSCLSSTARLANQDTSALTYFYTFDASAGAGVDIYVVGGYWRAHDTFQSQFGGRSRWGATFGGYPNADGNGHGTHCAGTAAGSQFGVAKAANIIAVKVLSDAGSGAVADIVSGLNFVLSSARSSGRPSIVSMSLGGSASTALDKAIASLTSAGVHVAVAAGNSNTNAANTSPARAPTANTVGVSTITDAHASFSNFGAVVDVFAPSQNIISSWIGSNTATNNISGASMATPHIAGLIAYLIGLQGNVTPASMSTKLKSLSVKGVLTGIHESSGTLNDLAHNA